MRWPFGKEVKAQHKRDLDEWYNRGAALGQAIMELVNALKKENESLKEQVRILQEKLNSHG